MTRTFVLCGAFLAGCHGRTDSAVPESVVLETAETARPADSDSDEPIPLACEPVTGRDDLAKVITGVWSARALYYSRTVEPVSFVFRGDGTAHYDIPATTSPEEGCFDLAAMSVDATWRAMGPEVVLIEMAALEGDSCGDGFAHAALTDVHVEPDCHLTAVSDGVYWPKYYGFVALWEMEKLAEAPP